MEYTETIGFIILSIIVAIVVFSVMVYAISIITKIIVSSYYETKRKYDQLKNKENHND